MTGNTKTSFRLGDWLRARAQVAVEKLVEGALSKLILGSLAVLMVGVVIGGVWLIGVLRENVSAVASFAATAGVIVLGVVSGVAMVATLRLSRRTVPAGSAAG